jgi:hypothetical protein
VAELLSKRDLIIEIVLQRRLSHDRFNADAIDRLALEVGSGGFDFDFVPGPVVRIAEGVFQRLPIGPVQDHGFGVAFKMQDVLLFGVLATFSLATCEIVATIGRSFTSEDFRYLEGKASFERMGKPPVDAHVEFEASSS